MDLDDLFSRLKERWSEISGSARARRLIKIVRTVTLLAILALLAYELTDVGWDEVLNNPPTAPLFYLFFILLYFLLPITEVIIYRLVFHFDIIHSFPTFIRKRVLNRDVLGYSGEVYFFSWARQNLKVRRSHLMETIRDNNIISVAASTLVALILLVIFMLLGELSITEIFGDQIGLYLLTVAFILAILIPVGIRFRRYIFSMPIRTAVLIFAIQILRLVIGQSLQIGMWMAVIPEVSLSVWFSFAAISIILTRIPFLPNHSLIFAGVGIALSTKMSVPEASWASMLLVVVAMEKILNLGLFGLISARDTAGITRATTDGGSIREETPLIKIDADSESLPDDG